MLRDSRDGSNSAELRHCRQFVGDECRDGDSNTREHQTFAAGKIQHETHKCEASCHPDGRKQRICFSDCYALDARMNFGFMGADSIRSAFCKSDGPELAAIRQRWAIMGADLSKLHRFEISTNSTGSTIGIYAMQFEVSELG